jgi:hypothetical protein
MAKDDAKKIKKAKKVSSQELENNYEDVSPVHESQDAEPTEIANLIPTVGTITHTERLKNPKTKKEFDDPIWIPKSADGKNIIFPVDPFYLNGGGIPRIGQYTKTEKSRQRMDIEEDSQPALKKLFKFAAQLDKHFGSMAFRESLFKGHYLGEAKYMKKMVYSPIVSIADDDVQAKRKVDGKDPRKNRIRTVFDTDWNEDENATGNIKTYFYVGTKTEAEPVITVDDAIGVCPFKSKVAVILSLAKIWCRKVDSTWKYGVRIKLLQVCVVERPMSGGRTTVKGNWFGNRGTAQAIETADDEDDVVRGKKNEATRRLKAADSDDEADEEEDDDDEEKQEAASENDEEEDDEEDEQKADSEEDDDDEEEEEPPKPKGKKLEMKKASKNKKVVSESDDDDDNDEDDEEEAPNPKGKKGAKGKKAESDDEEEAPNPKGKKGAKGKKAESDDEEEAPNPKGKKGDIKLKKKKA